MDFSNKSYRGIDFRLDIFTFFFFGADQSISNATPEACPGVLGHRTRDRHAIKGYNDLMHSVEIKRRPSSSSAQPEF